MQIIGDVCELGLASVDAVTRYGIEKGWAEVTKRDELAKVQPPGGVPPQAFKAWRPGIEKAIYVSASSSDVAMPEGQGRLDLFTLELASELGTEADWSAMATRLFGTEPEGEQAVPDGSLKTLFWSAKPTAQRPSETALRITHHTGHGFKILLINHRRKDTNMEPSQ